MPQFNSAVMTCSTHRRVATTAGHIIMFVPNEPTFVPALAVQACRQAGATVVKQASNTSQSMPAPGSKGRIEADVTIYEDDLNTKIEDFESLEDVDFSTEDEPVPQTKVFTETEERVRQGILSLLSDSSPEHWTGDNRPKIGSLSKACHGASVTGKIRDRVWNKMEEQGEIPENYAYLLGL